MTKHFYWQTQEVVTSNGTAGYAVWWYNEPISLKSDPYGDNINLVYQKDDAGMQVAQGQSLFFPICEIVHN